MKNTEPTPNLPAPLWTRDFLLIVAANLVTFLSFQMLMPTLPALATSLGGKETAAGLVIAIFTVSAVLMRPFAGRGLDTYGRKVVYIAGLLIFFGSVLGYAIVPSVLLLLAVRFIHGIGWGLSSTAAGTIATDLVPRERLGEGMGFYALTGTVAMAVAPAAGIFLMNEFGFGVLFTVGAALMLVVMLIANLIEYPALSEVNTGASAAATDVAKHSGLHAFVEVAALRPSLVVFFMAATYGAIVSFIVLFTKELGIENAGPFFAVYAIVLALTRPLAGSVADRKGYDIVVVPGTIVTAISLVVLSQATALPGLLAAGALYGAGFGLVQPALQAMAVRDVSPRRRGAANGTFFSFFDLGIGIGSALGGAIAAAIGFSLMYLLTSIPVALALLVYYVTGSKNREAEST